MATDLWDADRDVEVALASLASRGHDVTLLPRCSPPTRLIFPSIQRPPSRQLEGGGEVQVNRLFVREDYRRAVIDINLRWRRNNCQA